MTQPSPESEPFGLFEALSLICPEKKLQPGSAKSPQRIFPQQASPLPSQAVLQILPHVLVWAELS
jgi:hypothetical protein